MKILLYRHSNGSTEDNNYDGEFQQDDGGSLSRSDSEDNVAQIQNGHNNNNNGYTHKSMFETIFFPLFKEKKIFRFHFFFVIFISISFLSFMRKTLKLNHIHTYLHTHTNGVIKNNSKKHMTCIKHVLYIHITCTY